jgi:hypothetical protein
MADIRIHKQNESYIKIECDRSIAQEIKDEFSFYAAGYKFQPRYKMGVWDGRISLFNLNTRQMGFGIVDQLEKFAEDRGYEIENRPSVEYGLVSDTHSLSKEDFQKFIDGLGLPETHTVRDYQFDAAYDAITRRRLVALASTGSGKSLMIYLVCRYMNDVLDEKVMLVVPTTQLVHQMVGDFTSYGGDPEMCHKIMAGADKNTDKMVVVTTWQSMARVQDDKYFHDIGCMLADECFDGETKIRTPSGLKKLKHLTKGEEILNINSKGEIQVDVIEKVHTNLAISSNEKMYRVTFDDGYVCEVTGNHKFKLCTGEWKRIDQITAEDELENINEKERQL